jgi:hypothetical protein
LERLAKGNRFHGDGKGGIIVDELGEKHLEDIEIVKEGFKQIQERLKSKREKEEK